MEKLSVLLTLVISSSLGGLLLFVVASRGRNLQKFRDRQLLREDLYRFTVAILVAFAWYLVGIDSSWLRALAVVPDTLFLLLGTAVPTFLLMVICGRWFLGYGMALVTQGFILGHGGVLSAALWGGHALLDLGGVLMWLVVDRVVRVEDRWRSYQRYLMRFRMEKAGHVE